MLRYRQPVLFFAFGLFLCSSTALADEYFLLGNEAAVVALLHPHSDENLVIGSWSLETLEVGPSCEIRMGFMKEGADEPIKVTITPALSGTGSFSFAWAQAKPEDLGGPLETLLRGNDPGDFFRDRCQSKSDNHVEDEPDAAEVSSWIPSPAAALWIGALVLGIAGLFLLGWRGKKKKKKDSTKSGD